MLRSLDTTIFILYNEGVREKGSARAENNNLERGSMMAKKIVVTDKKTGTFDPEQTAANVGEMLVDLANQLLETGGKTTVKIGKDKQYDREVAANTFKIGPSTKKDIVWAAGYILSMFQSSKKGNAGRKVMVDDAILTRLYVDYRRAYPDRPLKIVPTAVANAYNEEVGYVRPISATYVANMAKKGNWEESLVPIPDGETITADDVETVEV